MRILILNDFIEKIGGAEMYDFKLKSLLEEQGHKVMLFGGEKRHFHPLRHYFESIFNIHFYHEIRNIIRRFRPAVIFAHSITEYISPSFLLVAEEYGIPVVHKPAYLSAYKFSSLSESSHPLGWLRTLIQRTLIKTYVDHYVPPSITSAECLKAHVGIKEENITIIRNFIEWESKRSVKKTRRKRILYVGRLAKDKGVKYLIQALQYIDEELDVRLEIVGQGPETTTLKKMAKEKNLSGKIKFHGYVPYQTLPEIYSQATIFVLPSIIRENAPLTPLEAMSQGVPVITTNIGGQAELVKGGFNGYLVEPKDPKELAKRIEGILRDSLLREKLSKNAVSFVRNFSSERHVQQLLQVFDKLVKP